MIENWFSEGTKLKPNYYLTMPLACHIHSNNEIHSFLASSSLTLCYCGSYLMYKTCRIFSVYHYLSNISLFIVLCSTMLSPIKSLNKLSCIIFNKGVGCSCHSIVRKVS